MQDAFKKKAINRIRRAVGHLKSVEKMLEDDRYCIDILQQSLAVQNALKSADQFIIDNHLHTCLSQAVKDGGETKEKAIREILAILDKKRG
ncbi:metal-sensitive transcriptional regulator [Candidatus Microgenomates bacterium]|nr:metal-sensitive transcriptional regulator [Candidatus Microgenomates bacterium]